jgi:hypothetical protein
MDGEQTESFTSFGQALDAAVAKRDPDSASAPQHTSGDGENGGTSAHSTPDGGTSSTPSGKSGTSNPTNGDTSAKGTGTKTANQGSENQRDNNFRNMSRRIRQRENFNRVNSRIQQLRQEQQELLATQDPQSILLAHQKGSEIENLQALQQDAQYSEWSQRAAECFGNDADRFLDQSERYGEYVNKNEPELVSYIDRPFGMFVYKSWMDQMENGDFRNRWVGLTAYEKGAVLNTIYKQIINFANGTQQQSQSQPQVQVGTQQAPAGNQPSNPAPANVPVPGSGRTSNQIPSPGSFGEALENALNKRGISRL